MFYEKYRDGLIALGLVFGIGAPSIGYLVRNSGTRPSNRNKVVNKTLGVIIDSSLSKDKVEDIRSVLYEVLDDYARLFRINYDVRFSFVRFPEKETTRARIYGLKRLPTTHTVYFTSARLYRFNLLGITDYEHNAIIINNIDSQCSELLYTVIAHELAHINGRHGHAKDKDCLMYKSAGCERKPFCDETIEMILDSK